MSKNRNNSKILGNVKFRSVLRMNQAYQKSRSWKSAIWKLEITLVNLKIFRKKGDKLSEIIYIVELDELFPKNGV